MYFEKSITTATLQHCPARLVPAAARQDRRIVLAGQSHGGLDVLHVPRNDHADRRLAVIRAIGRIERSGALVEPHFAVDRVAERSFQRGGGFGVKSGPRIIGCEPFTTRRFRGQDRQLMHHSIQPPLLGSVFAGEHSLRRRRFPSAAISPAAGGKRPTWTRIARGHLRRHRAIVGVNFRTTPAGAVQHNPCQRGTSPSKGAVSAVRATACQPPQWSMPQEPAFSAVGKQCGPAGRRKQLLGGCHRDVSWN